MAVIAIDGVASSGKSTLARSMSRELDWSYLDTGAMYRTLALAALNGNVSWDDGDALAELAKTMELQLDDHAPVEPGAPTNVTLDGIDVSRRIREPEIGKGASSVAVHAKVRTELVRQQQEWIARHPNCVVEGRDIGSVVAPNADVKIFLTANPEQRVERRADQTKKLTDAIIDLDTLQEQMNWRDKNDAEKGGLQQVEDAVVIDTTNLEPEETLQVALAIVRTK